MFLFQKFYMETYYLILPKLGSQSTFLKSRLRKHAIVKPDTHYPGMQQSDSKHLKAGCRYRTTDLIWRRVAKHRDADWVTTNRSRLHVQIAGTQHTPGLTWQASINIEESVIDADTDVMN